ncbi:ribose-phosphate diphosphokinase [Azospirillum sp. RWY-5-1]|uniref:Ribose-phosphate diphosphokinase n=1 Tax=Azospirillum oleiclasticum TaxID=2735135 RepID=A0ABX2T4V4_9PROT|nr:ribose-phosphate diphosphokinase [Azospirillum oleiclasticum]NYZ10991.1 ribose-phosphate diphosphokinase [Azospirillum oleiclasticum]NYZ18153.1 ribose-phosphate diphosphokinase [Azospirillum oleiclasticum]
MARYTGVYGFPESADGARRLADALGLACHIAELHRFPDGESLVRLPATVDRAIVYRSLDRPNDKLVELALAASVLRRQGATELCLVVPYMAYMRQDAVFRPGEPVSQTVVGEWLGAMFDRFVCVEPHLHRTHALDSVFGGRPAVALSGAGVIVRRLTEEAVSDDTVIVGPDEEAEPLVEAVARPLGLSWAVGRKVRRGDRDVTVELPAGIDLSGRSVVIVDDVISSGMTILSCLEAARRRGARRFRVFGVHALHERAVTERFAAMDVEILSCDGVPHPTNALPLAGMIADALRG